MKNKLDNAQSTVLLFLITSIILPALVQLIGENFLKFEFLQDRPFLSFVIYCVGFAFITLVIIMIIKGIKFLVTKRDYFEEANKKIKSVCRHFNFAQGDTYTQMYTLPDSNEINRGAINRYGVQPKKEKKQNIIYYGFSAKKYLNWIDYVYLNFLRKLKEKLDCKIVIALHFPDDIKECKVKEGADKDPNDYISEYNKTFDYFSNFVRKIIGNDVVIYKENQLYKLNVKKYAEDFHNVYVSTVLYYGNKIGSDINGEQFTYKEFKRKLSHIESAFPTWMMSLKSKHDRIYVLDNKLSQQLWEIEPLKSIRREHNIYFIEVTSLCKKNGERINVHNINNVCNLTDSESTLVRKISELDLETKQMMITLMDETLINTSDFIEPSEHGIDDKLLKVLKNCIALYNLNDPECSLEEYDLTL